MDELSHSYIVCGSWRLPLACLSVSEVKIKHFRVACIYFKTAESGFITFCSASHHQYETVMGPMKNELLAIVWLPEKVFYIFLDTRKAFWTSLDHHKLRKISWICLENIK